MKRWKRHLMIFAVFVFTVFGAQSVMATDVLKVAIVDRSDHTKFLADAQIAILDKSGVLVHEWTSTTSAYEVPDSVMKNLKTGEVYTIRETVTPKNYNVTTDTKFRINDDGSVTYSASKGTNGELLVEDEKATKGTGSIKVTKYTLKNNGAFKVVSQTFYTALFSDSALTKRVSDIKPIVLQNAYTTEVTFTNLPFGTYYVAETDATGKPYTKSATVTNVSITNGTAQISGVNPTANAIIKNTVAEGVLGAYVSVNLTVNKKVVGTNGKANKVKDTFYFALYSDKNFTNQIRGTSIQKVTLNNASSGSAVFRDLPYTDEIYVAEVDKNGNLVEMGKNGFRYLVSYEGNGITYDVASKSSVNVTNKFNPVDIDISGKVKTTPNGYVHYYTGSEIRPGAVVVLSPENMILKEGVDYMITYANNVNIGMATITVTGISNYTGTDTVYFQIIEDPTKKKESTDSGKTTTKSNTSKSKTAKQEKITICTAPKSVKAKAKKNKVTVSWKKIKKNKSGKKLLKQIKSIQVQYSTDPKFKQNVKTKSVGKKKTKVTLKLRKKTTYYVRVRYKGANGFSKWSKEKKAKVK